MKISILGTGVVGQTIAQKLVGLNHHVFLGSRNASETLNKKEKSQMTGISFQEWHNKNNAVNVVNYSELPADSDFFINATSGSGSIQALDLCGKEKLKGKTVIDISNPLDFSKGMPPTLSICNDNSLGEEIQRTFSGSNIVKTLNTMSAHIMVQPSILAEGHHVFISGNNAGSKNSVSALLLEFGWKKENIIDLGDISSARGTEMILPVWLRLWGALGTAQFNFRIVK